MNDVTMRNGCSCPAARFALARSARCRSDRKPTSSSKSCWTLAVDTPASNTGSAVWYHCSRSPSGRSQSGTMSMSAGYTSVVSRCSKPWCWSGPMKCIRPTSAVW